MTHSEATVKFSQRTARMLEDIGSSAQRQAFRSAAQAAFMLGLNGKGDCRDHLPQPFRDWYDHGVPAEAQRPGK